MKITTDLSDFNRHVAQALSGTFAASVKPMQSEDGTLLFRGPIPIQGDPSHVGTHVAVSLEKEVKAALDASSASEREEMTENLINSLSARVKAQYNPKNVGPYALDVVGTMSIARG